MKKYTVTLNEEQLMLISNCLEDLHRFACGDTRLGNTSLVLNQSSKVCDRLSDLHDTVTPELDRGQSYDWAGNGCKNEGQRKFIAQTYYLYREMLHQVALANKWNNVYSSPTLTCEDSGGEITVTWKEKV